MQNIDIHISLNRPNRLKRSYSIGSQHQEFYIQSTPKSERSIFKVAPPKKTNQLLKEKNKKTAENLAKNYNLDNYNTLEILSKISELSPDYNNLLQLLSEEISKIPELVGPSKTPFQSSSDYQKNISFLNSQSYEADHSLQSLENVRDNLTKEIHNLEDQLESLTNEYNHYQHLLHQLSPKEDEPTLQFPTEETNSAEIEQNELLKRELIGQNRHLRYEKRRLIELIQTQRNHQFQLICDKAKSNWKNEE